MHTGPECQNLEKSCGIVKIKSLGALPEAPERPFIRNEGFIFVRKHEIYMGILCLASVKLCVIVVPALHETKNVLSKLVYNGQLTSSVFGLKD